MADADTQTNTAEQLTETAEYMATAITRGFQLHDEGNREEALEAFAIVDRNQFAHIDDQEVRRAAEAFVDALWAKDEIEEQHIEDNGEFRKAELRMADWSPVQDALERRADVIGMDEAYAHQATKAWRNHKTGGDYWTPFMEAQLHQLKAAMQDPNIPHKPRYGQSGYGPEVMRYLTCVELHDMHSKEHWRQAKQMMVPYYERILKAHQKNGYPIHPR
ncbi:MAG: hypothetical protein ABEH65_02700 [Halobacteriales archaeon]